jgi:DNA repair photolyase
VKPRPLSNPPNPWSTSEVVYLEPPPAALHVYEDRTREILSHNDSPDISFRWSVNPYRGCMHGCAYCYARPTHEYLGFGTGTDFETRIVVKPHAAELLRAAFERPSWRGETIAFSGGTDCYQPLEASLRLTRACLEVCAEYRNPVSVVTKAALIERDLDVLRRLADDGCVEVMLSIPMLDPERARALEPWAAAPERRLRAIERLASAGIPVGVLVAPVIPGLSDEELPRVLEAARQAGARWAGWALLRLPGSVRAVFQERLRAALPERAERVLHRLRDTRRGRLNDCRYVLRERGEGEHAKMIARLFAVTSKRLGFEAEGLTERPSQSPFRRPAGSAQLEMFEHSAPSGGRGEG